MSSATDSGVAQKQEPPGTNQLDLLLSLDVALELIHADREALKRVETFAGYPGHYGHRVRDTIEELFILVLQTLGERHVTKGFSQWVTLYPSHSVVLMKVNTERLRE